MTSVAQSTAAATLPRTASAASPASGIPASGIPASGATTSGATTQGSNALGALSSNFGNFLSLLMTQLKNQDPSSPLDTNQFTSQLVQFSSVEQQINTNTSLTKLIELTQATEVTQSAAILGKPVTVQSSQIALQNGSGSLQFAAPSAMDVSVAVTNAAGQKVRDATVPATAGANTWAWDGKDNTGKSVPDGAYAVAVTGGATGAPASALPFTVVGTATGVTTQNNTVNLQLGALSVPFSAVRSVGGN